MAPLEYDEYTERILCNVARFLAEGKQEDELRVLLSCEVDVSPYKEVNVSDASGKSFKAEIRQVALTGARATYDSLLDHQTGVADRIGNAFQAVFEADQESYHRLPVYVNITPRYALMEQVDTDWRNQLLRLAAGETASNQGVQINSAKIVTWNLLNFRSASEVRIAQQLDKRQVLFFPNCMARLGFQQRVNREADFLVCYKGKWGIIEVDGEPFHPASRKVQEDERDRLFKAYGVKTIEHFDASDCFEDSETVVKKFLYLLEQPS